MDFDDMTCSTSPFSASDFSADLAVILLNTALAFWLTRRLLKSFGKAFISAGLKGVDMNKATQPVLCRCRRCLYFPYVFIYPDAVSTTYSGSVRHIFPRQFTLL
nr:unnamed protein product [Spirometra erinaceieuropaei]